MISKHDKEVLQHGLPYIRSILAFLLYVRGSSTRNFESSYEIADKFVKQLQSDLEE